LIRALRTSSADTLGGGPATGATSGS